MLILVLLGMYFDAVVVFVTSQTLSFRLALAICTVILIKNLHIFLLPFLKLRWSQLSKISRYFILAYSKLTSTALQYEEPYFCEEILSAANICLKLKAPLIYGTLFRTPQKKIGIRESHCSNSYDFKKILPPSNLQDEN